MRILVKWPTRGTPDGLSQRLQRWRLSESGANEVRYLLTVDQDDPASINSAKEAIERCKLDDVDLHMPEPRGKVAACNAGVPDPTIWNPGRGWDVLILASDDFQPEISGWDDVVARAISWHFPALDGCLHFPDANSAHDRFPTIPIMGVNYYRRFAYIYHPDYISLWCDREQGEVACRMHKSAYIDLPVFQHRWRGHYAPDDTLAKNQAFWEKDEGTYKARAARGFDLKSPDLSILVPALDSRREKSAKLFAEIYRQIWGLGSAQSWRVEIHILLDQKRRNVGEKRNLLLARARGKYICFVDDDDRIAPDYLSSLLETMDRSPAADCIVFAGEFQAVGHTIAHPKIPYDYDLKYHTSRNTPALLERTPNHLCPIRSEIAKNAKFPELNCGEDTEYARRVKPRLKTQGVCVDAGGRKKTLYYYDYDRKRTETQRAPDPAGQYVQTSSF
jgi:glycosyltransferase involved in cell wall biosynthesis